MKTPRAILITLTCIVGLGTGAATAGDEGMSWMPYHFYGHTGMQAPGYGWVGRGHGHGHGCGWSGHRGGMPGWHHGRMMGHGYGHMGHGYGHMGHGYGHMRRGALDAERLSDKVLDRIGERIAERHRTMQAIASEDDPAARRELVREHLKSRKQHGWHRYDDDGKPMGRGHGHDGMMGRGSGDPGMMGPGMGGPDMMMPGVMAPGMMHGNRPTDEALDRMSEQMAGHFERMQQLAGTTDKAKRRELMREMLESMPRYRGGMY